MSITISTAEDAVKMNEYEKLRDLPRQAMALGVYPNCVNALAVFDELTNQLSGDYSEYAAFHATVTAQVSSHIASLQAAMRTIVSTMEAIETAAPGTFGIEINSGAQDD